MIPSDGQPGGNTWSANSAARQQRHYGGGSMWESPLVDTKRDLAIFGTGNPEPWNSRGPGKNLYTDSIVALNLYTGQLVWYYQTPTTTSGTPTCRTTASCSPAKYQRIKGKTVVSAPGVAYVNKHGMTFILDRETGKPLLPIPEVKVPREHRAGREQLADAADPEADNVLFNKLDANRRPCTDGNRHADERVRPSRGDRADGKPYKIGCVYDPYDTTQYVVHAVRDDGLAGELVQPGEPHVHHLRRDGSGDARSSRSRRRRRSWAPSAATASAGSASATRRPPTRGNFSALNVKTGKLTWHQHWPAPCYSGSMNTAAGITFVGRLGKGNAQDGKGYLEALDTKTGASLWKSPLMDAGVGAAPVTYTAGGKQYVSVAVGGQTHNDVSRPLGLRTRPEATTTSTRSCCLSRCHQHRGGGADGATQRTEETITMKNVVGGLAVAILALGALVACAPHREGTRRRRRRPRSRSRPRSSSSCSREAAKGKIVFTTGHSQGRVSGALYRKGRLEYFQPAKAVLLAAYNYENTRILLLSTSKAFPNGLSNNHGQVGKHWIGHGTGAAGATGWFPGKRLNRYSGTLGQFSAFDELDADNFDHTGLGFIGGGMCSATMEAKPIARAGRHVPAAGGAARSLLPPHLARLPDARAGARDPRRASCTAPLGRLRPVVADRRARASSSPRSRTSTSTRS